MKVLRVVILCCITYCSSALLKAQDAPLVMAKHLTWSVLYDYGHMNPLAVWYILDESDFRGSISTKPKYFKMDTRLPKPRRNDKTFRKLGFQRGHLCPAGDRDSRKDWLKDTYYTSNVLLMTPECNQGAWRDIELLCRRLAVFGHRLFIACGPVYSRPTGVSNTIHESNIAAAVWKIAECVIHPDEKICWIVPNGNAWLNEKDCRVTLDSLSRSVPVNLLDHYELWKRQ